MQSRKLLLIGWDAADWKVINPLITAGKMPNLARLVENGATGQIATLHPPLSPMLWTSIATGKRPFKHGILGFSEPAADGRGIQPVTNLSRKSKALWNIFSQSGLPSTVIGWWPSHPAEPIHGVMLSDRYHRATAALEEGWPLAPQTVHPAALAETMAGLRVHPEQLLPEKVEKFIPLAKEIDQDRDKRLGVSMSIIAECMTIHAAALWLLENQPWDFFAVYFDSIDHFCHGFMKYHPPRQSWIGEREFELYHNVVTRGYQLHDEMLGTLLEKAGPDTTVVLLSDHGFHPDHLRPASIPEIPAGPAIEHRDLGILAIAGPGIRKRAVLDGASLLDIAPTVLALYGLPVGEDMDGNVLTQTFAQKPDVAYIPTWEAVSGPDGRHPLYTRLDPVAAEAALEQMIALGYVERPNENREIAVATAVRELRYNLGVSYQDAGRHQEAREIFAELSRVHPDEQRFAVRLFVSCQALGMLGEMRRIVNDASCFQPAVADYLRAQVLIAEKRYAEALSALERVTAGDLLRPSVFLETGDLYLRLGRPRDALAVYEKALALDPDNAQAHLGVCRVALRRRKYSLAAQSALEALARVDHDPLAHFLLGRALTGMREYTRAAEAFRVAILENPHFPEAHLRLADLIGKHFGDTRSAEEHRRLARQMRRGGPTPRYQPPTEKIGPVADEQLPAQSGKMPSLAESLVVVTGLPRAGTSMIMQMLAAGGVPILADQSRAADEDNPRGYLEFAPVKNLLADARCLLAARGKAVKIVAPLLSAVPPGLPCRVILIERDIEEVLDSQEQMLLRRNQPLEATPERRGLLKGEFARTLARTKVMLARRPLTRVLLIAHREAIADPLATAEKLNDFLGGSLDTACMAAAVDPALHRHRAV